MIDRMVARCCIFLLLATALPITYPLFAQDSTSVINIGNRRELFVDRHLLDSLAGTRLKLHHPEPAEIVLNVDYPWEGTTGHGLSVIQDGDTYHMYCQGRKPGERTFYACSQNGIRWEKPILGLIPINGSRANSRIGTINGKPLYPPGEPSVEVFLDRRSGVPRDERFKVFTLDESESPLVRVHAWVSANGTHFWPLQEAPILSTDVANVFDGQETMFRSEAEQMYLIYTSYATSRDRKTRKRSVVRMTSKDFLNWTEPVPMIFGSAGVIPPDQHYNNQTYPYFRTPYIYAALSARFMEGRQALPDEVARAAGLLEGAWQDCSETVLMTTRAAPTTTEPSWSASSGWARERSTGVRAPTTRYAA